MDLRLCSYLAARRDQDVGTLDVSVDHALVVEEMKSLEHLQRRMGPSLCAELHGCHVLFALCTVDGALWWDETMVVEERKPLEHLQRAPQRTGRAF